MIFLYFIKSSSLNILNEVIYILQLTFLNYQIFELKHILKFSIILIIKLNLKKKNLSHLP